MDKIRGIVAGDRDQHLLATGTSTHLVQFYENEEYLYDVLSDFLAPFMVNNESAVGAIVLARPRTIKYLEDCLVAREYAWDGAVDDEERRRKGGCGFVTSFGAVYRIGRRKILLVDAEEVLTRIVPKNELNTKEFDNIAIELLSQVHGGGPTGRLEPGEEDPHPIYAYGELVDMLCVRGQHLLALELETLWNRLLSSNNISLLCGYRMNSFRGSSVENIFAQICHSHATVTPTESYSNLTTANQKFAMIAGLQQQVTALRATQQLRWSDGDAEQRTRYREQVVDVLCHELRNPVSGIIGNVELLRMGLELRQGIICSHREGYSNGETRLSAPDMASLQNQLANDLVSVNAIAVCAEHMKAVSDDVLSLSKLDAGKVILEHMLFDLKATIISVITMFLASARKKGIELLANLPSEDLHVLGDRGRVAQVLVNLISNAIKFTDIGSVMVELNYLGPTHLGSRESLFKVVVRDTGCGLNKTEISLLFQRFSQPVSTSFAKHGGTGLGLYISKQLVELMGGLLYVESQEGKGSKFFFTFQAESCMVGGHTLQQHGNKRRLHDSVTTGSPSLSAASISHFPKKDQAGGVGVEKTECSSPASFPSLSNSAISIGTGISTRQYDTGVKHILVVDDNPIIVRILTRMLESVSGSSISINTALNGYDAISKLIAFSTSSLPIDLILMDLEMPFLNGLNTAREIRRLKHSDHEESQSLAQRRETERLAATLIVGLTGDVRESRFMEARESGMDDCIGKPITKETLRGLIQTIFTAKRGRQAEGIRLKLEGPALCSNGIPVAPGDGMTGAGVCKG